MKARIKQESCVLSIGMIVKNEHKHLRNCLEALQPLMKQVPCELVIVDTGSVDDTIEIAKEYTDKVYSFAWCNDFSAAKNEAMRHAGGKWYLSIDADEYMDDPGELVEFLCSANRDDYSTGSIVIRSYHGKKSFSDFMGMRLCKLGVGVHFEGKIHEVLVPYHAHYKSVGTVLRHYGYDYQSESERKLKCERNLKLLLERQEEMPGDLRTLCQIYDCSEQDKKADWVEKILAQVKQNWNHPHIAEAMRDIMNDYLSRNRLTDALQIAREYMTRRPENTVAKIDFQALYAQVLAGLGLAQETIDACILYESLVARYLKGDLDLAEKKDMLVTIINLASPAVIQMIQMKKIAALLQMGRLEEAESAIGACVLTDMADNGFQIYVQSLLTLCEKTGNCELLTHAYPEIVKADRYADAKNAGEMETEEDGVAKEWVRLFAIRVEKFCYEHDAVSHDVIQSLANVEICDELVEICRILADADKSGQEQSIRAYAENKSDWNIFGADTIYLLFKYAIPLPHSLFEQSAEEIEAQVQFAVKKHPEISGLLLRYRRAQTVVESICKLYWLVAAEEAAALGAVNASLEDKEDAVQLFLEDLALLIGNVYNPELLNEDDCKVLPARHQFGYHMMKAKEERDAGNLLGYIKRLRASLKANKAMKELVYYLQSSFTQDLEEKELQRKQEEAELAQIRKTFKEKIRQLANQGLRTECRQLLRQYGQLFPEDPEMLEIYRRIE